MKIAVGQLAQGLRHESGLQADMAVAHLTLDLGARDQGGDRVDDDQVDGSGADQHVGDLERLLPGVGLRDEHGVDVDAELAGVLGVERVLGVDERRDAARPLRVRDGVQGERGLAGRLRAVDLDDATAGQPADAEGDVERDGPGGDDLDRRALVAAEAHHRALAELAVDLRECGLEGLLAIGGGWHGAFLFSSSAGTTAGGLRLPIGCRPAGFDRAGGASAR